MIGEGVENRGRELCRGAGSKDGKGGKQMSDGRGGGAVCWCTGWVGGCVGDV